MVQFCVQNKTMTTKITDLLLVRSPYFFVLFHQRARTCWLCEPQRLARCLNPGPPTTNWGYLPVNVHTEHQDQSLYQHFHPLPSQNCQHSRYYFALSAFEKLGSLHMLYMYFYSTPKKILSLCNLPLKNFIRPVFFQWYQWFRGLNQTAQTRRHLALFYHLTSKRPPFRRSGRSENNTGSSEIRQKLNNCIKITYFIGAWNVFSLAPILKFAVSVKSATQISPSSSYPGSSRFPIERLWGRGWNLSSPRIFRKSSNF